MNAFIAGLLFVSIAVDILNHGKMPLLAMFLCLANLVLAFLPER